jgi:LPS-assembly protein
MDMGRGAKRAAAMLFASAAGLVFASMTLTVGAARAAEAPWIEKPQAAAQPQKKVLLRADTITYDANKNIVSAQGHVEIDYDQRILLADSVTYNQETDTVTADGKISVLAPDGSVAFADHVVLSKGMRDGVLNGFRALIGKDGRLAARRAVKSGDITYATRAVYSPCKICNKPGQRTPTWQVKAGKIVWDEKEHEIYYHDATLEMFGVPVFYSPILSHADPTVKHKSGFLRPQFGSSTTIGSFIRLPYYLALTDSRDMTFAPTFTSRGGQMLQTEYRERWNHGGMWLQASGVYNPDGGVGSQQRNWYTSLFGSGRVPLNNLWTAGYDVALTSNDSFLKRYSLSDETNLTSDVFLEAIRNRSRFAMTGYFFQDLRDGHPSSGQIPIILPLIEYSYVPRRDRLGGQFRFNFSTASLMRTIGSDSERASAEMRWRLPFVTDSGQLVTFTARASGDFFRVANNDPANDVRDLQGNLLPQGTRYISRGQPLLAVDWRWPFMAPGILDGRALVVEPIVQLVAAPYGANPAGIPNEDSGDFELDETNLFSLDRVPGHAQLESGPRANVGMRAKAFFPAGSVEVLLGEVWRLKPDPLFAPGSGISGKTSDIVGRYTIKFPPWLSLTHRVDIDSDSGAIRRNEVYLDGNYGRSNVEVSYLRLGEQALTQTRAREEVNGQLTLALPDHWALFAAARRDLQAQQMIDTEFGVGWENECLGLSISYQRRYTRSTGVPPSTSILASVKLRTGDENLSLSDLFPPHVFASR